MQLLFCLEHAIYLKAVGCSQEVYCRLLAMMQVTFEEISHDGGFKQVPETGSFDEDFRIVNPKQISSQRGIGEVEFGALRQSLAEVCVIGRSQKQNATGFQNRKPSLLNARMILSKFKLGTFVIQRFPILQYRWKRCDRLPLVPHRVL